MDFEPDDRLVRAHREVSRITRPESPANWSIRLAPWKDGETVPSSPLTDFLERIFPIGILALAIFGVPILVLEPEGLPRMRALEHELSDVTSENAALRQSVGNLRGEVKRLRDDPAAVERIARDQLGLVRKSEIVFQFPRAATTPSQASSPSRATTEK
jgi:cell division protein FtsB